MAAIKWSFENISPDLIELDLENNRLTFDHDNIEIDTKVFSFGKKVRSKWLEAMKTTQINFQIRWREFGMNNRRDEQYWIIIEVEEKTPPPTPIEESSLSVEDLKAAGGVMKRKARRRSRDRLPETARNAINEKNKKVGRKTQIPPEIFDKLKDINPNIEFSSDFIIGYPGEEQEDFQATFELINKLNLSILFHLFLVQDLEQ